MLRKALQFIRAASRAAHGVLDRRQDYPRSCHWPSETGHLSYKVISQLRSIQVAASRQPACGFVHRKSIEHDRRDLRQIRVVSRVSKTASLSSCSLCIPEAGLSSSQQGGMVPEHTAAVPRISSSASGFFFCGIRLEPVETASLSVIIRTGRRIDDQVLCTNVKEHHTPASTQRRIPRQSRGRRTASRLVVRDTSKPSSFAADSRRS